MSANSRSSEVTTLFWIPGYLKYPDPFAYKEHAVYVLRDIFQYFRTEAAHLLKEKPADVDVMLAQVRTRIGYSGSAKDLQFSRFDSDVSGRRIHDPPSEDAPRRENQLDRSQL